MGGGGGGGEESETEDEEFSLFLEWLETGDWNAFFAWLEEWSG